MYVVYLFREKKSGNVIYVGSSARPAERMKEHLQSLNGIKPKMKIHNYMLNNGLKLYRDVEVVWVDCANNKAEMALLEEQYYYQYQATLLNDRPGENRYGWYNPKRRAIRCVNDGKVFNTISECGIYYGKARTTIQRTLSPDADYPYTWVSGEKYYFEYVNKKV